MGISKIEYNGETLMDISGDTVTEDTLAKGSTAHNANGEQIVGRAVFGGNGGGESNILRVTAIAIPTSETGGDITITNSSFAQIREAYDNGCYIFIEGDLSYLGMNSCVTIPMSVIDFTNNYISFTRTIDLSGEPIYLGIYIFESGTFDNYMIRPLT